eukprot:jgi/Chlat1/3864/Chrsp26S04152
MGRYGAMQDVVKAKEASNNANNMQLAELAPEEKAQKDLEDFAEKLRQINEDVPTRIGNTSGSTAGAGSGDFHQASLHYSYRQMRRKEQDRLRRMDVEYKHRTEEEQFQKRRLDKIKEAEERTAKKRAKRQKKKDKKKVKKSVNGNTSQGEQHDVSSSDSDDDTPEKARTAPVVDNLD